MRAVKNNKEYIIDEKQKKSYQDAGFDIYNDDGKMIAYGKGKTVPYGDYAALAERVKTAEEENEILKAKVAEMTEAVASVQEKKNGKKAGD